jgi:hypothetical protein
MPTILIVEKNGDIKESNIKSWVESDLYKKAGFKSADGFSKMHEWTINETTVALYGKTEGRAGQENKYDFPPPVDTTLFFGACILTVVDGSLKKNQWESMYETLFGGFEDVGDDDSDESEDEDDELDLPRTKDGYVKDGFIVDDDDDEEDEEDDIDDDMDEEEEDDEVEEVVVKKPKKKAPPASAKKSKKQTVFEKIDTMCTVDENTFLDCTSELEEELYE